MIVNNGDEIGGNVGDGVRTAASRFIHFYSKGINSKSPAVGIRVGKSKGLNLPYVSVRCAVQRGVICHLIMRNFGQLAVNGDSNVMLPAANGLPAEKTDKEKEDKLKRAIVMAGEIKEQNVKAIAMIEATLADKLLLLDSHLHAGEREATALEIAKIQKSEQERINHLMEKSVFITINEDEVEYLKSVHDWEESAVVVNEGLDARMRQILLPDNHGGYLCAIPLASIQFAKMLLHKTRDAITGPDTLAEESAKKNKASYKKKYRTPTRIDYPVGGENPVNAGISKNGREMIVLGFYRKNDQASKRASALHGGISNQLKIDMEVLRSYALFIGKCNWSNQESVAHKGYIKRIVAEYLRGAKAIASTLSHADWDSALESSLDEGFVDDTCAMTSAWKDEFSKWVYQKMKNTPISTGGEDMPKYLVLGNHDKDLKKMIKEVVG